MKAHVAYLKYLIKHKLCVLIACNKLGVPYWRGLIHDWSKFLPSVWFAYRRAFYKDNGDKTYVETLDFAYAWNRHQKLEPHHWQYWLLTWDRGTTEALEMPEKYVREMIADWIGAGLAITGRRDVADWYTKNKNKMRLHPNTRTLVETLISD